ncbi:hypothetical protein DH09_12230 [Bacillaceae bacterium JMAK1]|nr:hypothetical protein DH09_12230 [Bacillaceae bacterium JMAK1]
MNVTSVLSVGLLLLPWIFLTVAILYATLKKPWRRERVLYAGLGFLTSVLIIAIVPIHRRRTFPYAFSFLSRRIYKKTKPYFQKN